MMNKLFSSMVELANEVGIDIHLYEDDFDNKTIDDMNHWLKSIKLRQNGEDVNVPEIPKCLLQGGDLLYSKKYPNGYEFKDLITKLTTEISARNFKLGCSRLPERAMLKKHNMLVVKQLEHLKMLEDNFQKEMKEWKNKQS